jgi:2-amino-4-hydroxy-6-hydroxymethyldihydropteridine diphosphokinase
VLKLNEAINPPTRLVLVEIGSNIRPEKNIKKALSLLGQFSKVIKRGKVWQTPAYGSQGPEYLNISVLLETELTLGLFKKDVLGKIENQLGRTRTSDKYADREIDLDVLIFDNEVIDDELWTLPHVLIPSADVLPDLQNPSTGESICRAAKRLLPGSNFTKRLDI